MHRGVTCGESPTDINSSSIEHQRNLKIKLKRIINSCHANIYIAEKFVTEYVKNFNQKQCNEMAFFFQ